MDAFPVAIVFRSLLLLGAPEEAAAEGSAGVDVDASAAPVEASEPATTAPAVAAAPEPTAAPTVTAAPVAQSEPAPEPAPVALEPEAQERPAPEPEPARGQQGISEHTTRTTTIGGPEIEGDGFRMNFHGFVSAPLRFGVGRRDNPNIGQSRTTIHSPIIPDDQYLGYQHTSHAKRSWAELYLSAGNDTVKGVVAVQAWNFSDIGYQNPNAQLGIGQAFVSITPKFRRSPVRLRVKVGGHDNRYGMAGKYNQGMYETYIFGRTRYLGETVGVDIPYRDFRFTVEHGFGGTPKDPNIFNRSRLTMTAHHHFSMAWKDRLEFGLHHIVAFSQEEASDGAQYPDDPDGNLQVFGPELRMDWGRGGYWYLGYSYANLKNARVVGPSLEVLHSFGGGYYDLGLIGNYFDYRRDASGYIMQESAGTGSIQTLMLQTEHSLHEIIAGENGFWGEDWDLKLTLYGMMNFIQSDVAGTDGIRKTKFGADLMGEALPWLGIGAKFDQVMPNNRIRQQTWSVLSPRLEFRTNWVAHETITIQYSRYFYAVRDCGSVMDPLMCVQPPSAAILGEGYGSVANMDDGTVGAPAALPDHNVFAIMANIYW